MYDKHAFWLWNITVQKLKLSFSSLPQLDFVAVQFPALEHRDNSKSWKKHLRAQSTRSEDEKKWKWVEKQSYYIVRHLPIYDYRFFALLFLSVIRLLPLCCCFFACPSTTSNDREGRRGANDSNGSKYSEKIIELRENYNLKCKQFGMVLQWGHPTGLLGGLLWE